MKQRTEREVAAFARRSAGGRSEFTVGGVPGLVARVSESGAVSYALRYRDQGGRQRTLTLGPLTLSKAREHARYLLAQARTGRDQWEQRRAARLAADEERARTERTVAALMERWLRSTETAHWRPTFRQETERIYRHDVLPVIGRHDANEVTRGMLRKLVDDIAARPAPVHANRVLGALRLLWGWLRAERQESLRVSSNPVQGMRPTREKARDVVYTDDQLRAIVAATAGTQLGERVLLIMHAATRDGETRAMRWTDVDFDRALWTIPSTDTKTGEAALVPLSTGALAVLRRQRDRSAFEPYVWAAPTRQGYAGRPNKVLAAASESLGFALRPHDIRRTVRTRLPGLGVSPDIAERCLNHAVGGIRAVYDHYDYLKEKREALNLWCAELAHILGGRRDKAKKVRT